MHGTGNVAGCRFTGHTQLTRVIPPSSSPTVKAIFHVSAAALCSLLDVSDAVCQQQLVTAYFNLL